MWFGLAASVDELFNSLQEMRGQPSLKMHSLVKSPSNSAFGIYVNVPRKSFPIMSIVTRLIT